MGRWTPTDVAAAQQRIADTVNRAQKAYATATPQMAANMADDHAKYGWLSPATITLLNQAGASDLVRQTAAYASARAGMQQGTVFPEQIDPAMADPTVKKHKRGFWEKAFHPINWVGEKVAGALPEGVRGAGKGAVRLTTTALSAPYQTVQNIIGKDVINPVMRTVRDVRHGNFGDLPGDLLNQGVAGAKVALGPAASIIGGAGFKDGKPTNDIIDATDAAQGVRNPNKMGSGFFAGKGVQDLTSQAQRDVRGVDAGGHAWTIGRFVAAPLPQNSKAHTIISGATDVVSAFALDPLNVIGGATAPLEHAGGLAGKLNGPVANLILKTRRAGEAEKLAQVGELLNRSQEASRFATMGEDVAHTVRSLGADASHADLAGAAEAVSRSQGWARHADELVKQAEDIGGITKAVEKATLDRGPDWVNTVRAAAGLVDSPKGQTAIAAKHFKWLLSEEGQKVVDTLKNVDSAETVWGMYRGKIPVDAAVKIADAKTGEDVIRALGGALDNAGLRGPTPASSLWAVTKKAQIGEQYPTLARAMGFTPKGTWMNFADPEQALQTLYDTLGNAKITGTKRTDLFNRWAKALTEGDRAGMYQLGVETNDALAEKLVAAGMAKEDATDITRAFMKKSDRMVANSTFPMDDFVRDSLSQQVPSQFLDGADNAPLRVTQILDGGWGIMDPAELEKVRIQTGNMKALIGLEGSRRRMPLTAIQWYQDRVFKPLAVTRPALFLRLLPDEAMRIMFGGHVSDAGGFFQAIANHPKTSAMGEMFDAPGELLKLDRKIETLRKGATGTDEALAMIREGRLGDLIAKHPDATAALSGYVDEQTQLAEIARKLASPEAKLSPTEAARLRILTPNGEDPAQAVGQALKTLEEKIADPNNALSLPDLTARHQRMSELSDKILHGDSLTPDEADVLEQIAVKHGGGSALDALHQELGSVEGKMARAVTDNPELADLYEQRSVLERQFSRRQQGIIEVLTGQRGDATIARRFNGRGVDDTVLYKSGSRVIIDKRNPELYKAGLIDEIMSMGADPVYRRIANGGLLPGDVIHDDIGHVGQVVDEYTRRRAELDTALKSVGERRTQAEQALADVHAAHEQELAPVIQRRDELIAARDAGRQRVAERDQVAAAIAKERDRVAQGVDMQAGVAAKNRLDEATARVEAAKADIENQLSGMREQKRAAVEKEWNPRRSTERNLEAQKALKDEWDAKIAQYERNSARRLDRQNETVGRLKDEYDATGHAKVDKLDRRLTEARKDAATTRRIEARDARKDGSVDVRKEIADTRAKQKGAVRKAEGRISVVEREQARIEKEAAKIEAAMKKGLLTGNGRTHLGEVPTTLDDVKTWLYKGNGREFTEKYARATGHTIDEKFVSDWVDLMTRDVDQHWGQNAEARAAIAHGKVRGESIREPSRQWGPKPAPGEKLREFIGEYADTAEAPSHVRYEPTLEEARRHKLSFAEKAAGDRRRLFDTAFAKFYGNPSDRFIRIPEYAGSYWQNMESMIPRLSPDEAARMLPAIDEAFPKAERGVISSLVKDRVTGSSAMDQGDRLRTLVRSASGHGLLEDADQLAHGYALDDVKKLLFDMERTNQFQDMTRILAPFGRAWWEVISTWGKIGLSNPTELAGTAGKTLGRAIGFGEATHAVDKGIRAARGAGVFYPDETGQEVFNYPLSGPLAQAFASVFAPGSAGQVQSMFRAKVSSLSIGTQVLPGIGPVVGLPVYELTKHLPVPDAAVKLLFPFGKPESLAGAAMPAWAEKLTASFNADEHEQIFGNTLFEVARGLANSGMYGTDAASLERLMKDARKQAQALTALRGLVQATGPAAPIPTYIAHTGTPVVGKDGKPTGEFTGPDMTVVKLAQEYQKLINDPKEVAALGAKSPSEAMLMKFGPSVVNYLWGKTKTVSGGMTASEEFGNWQESNTDLAGKYPLVFGYFGPQSPGYSQTVAQRQVEEGTRQKRSANDVLALANAKIADIMYYGMRDKVMAENRAAGVNKLTQDQSAWFAKKRAELEDQFPGWDVEARSAESRAKQDRQIAQLRQAAADPKVAESPTGKTLQTYMRFRALAVDEATQRGITGWGQANATQDLRDWLSGKAAKLALEDAGFAAMYDDVLSREMKD